MSEYWDGTYFKAESLEPAFLSVCKPLIGYFSGELNSHRSHQKKKQLQGLALETESQKHMAL